MTRRILFFSKKELAVIIAVGIVTGILDDRVEMVEFALIARSHAIVMANDYLAYVTGGPIFGDLVETWLEFGGVVAACLVRRPGAGTIALTVNGCMQVFVNGTHDPHLLYGVPGLGADLVFAFFEYKRYDWLSFSLAGVACAVFWYPIVWFTHGIYVHPLSFVLPDFALRVLGSAVGDGFLGGAVAVAVIRLAGRPWDAGPTLTLTGERDPQLWNSVGLLVASLGVLLVALTHASSSVAGFFQQVGPKIPTGLPSLEEYNLGYIIGVLLIFLVLVVLGFRKLESS